MNLNNKNCTPCKGGVKSLSKEQANNYLNTELTDAWSLTTDCKWLHASYKFKNFITALKFVNKIGEIAEQEKHHPDISLGWGYVKIKIQTHAISGLHENDFILGSKIAAIAPKAL